MIKMTKLSPVLLIALSAASARAQVNTFEDYFQRIHEHHNRMLRDMAAFSDALFDDYDYSIGFKALPKSEQKEGEKQLSVIDRQAVNLPAIDVKSDKDSVTLSLKDASIKKEQVAAHLDRENEYVSLEFPHEQGKVNIYIFPRYFEVEAQKKITNEKKDDSGKVISSSSYKAYNSMAKSLPARVELETVKPELKDGTLTITFQKLQPKQTIAIK